MKTDFYKNLKAIYHLIYTGNQIHVFRLDLEKWQNNATDSIEMITGPWGITDCHIVMQDNVRLYGSTCNDLSKCLGYSRHAYNGFCTKTDCALTVQHLVGLRKYLEEQCPKILEDGQNALWCISAREEILPQLHVPYRLLFSEAGFVHAKVFAQKAYLDGVLAVEHEKASKDPCGILELNDSSIRFYRHMSDETVLFSGFPCMELLDNMILAANLFDSDRYCLNMEGLNQKSVLDAAQQRLNDTFSYNILLHKIQDLRRQYYTNRCAGNWMPCGEDLTTSITLSPNTEPLVLFVNDFMMTELLEQRSIEEVVAPLQKMLSEPSFIKAVPSCTWKSCLTDFLINLPIANKEAPLSSLILMGEGYCIDTVYQTVMELYPDLVLKPDSPYADRLCQASAICLTQVAQIIARRAAMNELIEPEDGSMSIHPSLLDITTGCFMELFDKIINQITNCMEKAMKVEFFKIRLARTHTEGLSEIYIASRHNEPEKIIKDEIAMQLPIVRKKIREVFLQLIQGPLISDITIDLTGAEDQVFQYIQNNLEPLELRLLIDAANKLPWGDIEKVFNEKAHEACMDINNTLRLEFMNSTHEYFLFNKIFSGILLEEIQ